MEEKEKFWDHFFNPLYFPLITAVPIETWLLLKESSLKGVEISLYIIGILFLVFSGAIETSSEETKHRVVGYIYLISALGFGTTGLKLWLY